MERNMKKRAFITLAVLAFVERCEVEHTDAAIEALEGVMAR